MGVSAMWEGQVHSSPPSMTATVAELIGTGAMLCDAVHLHTFCMYCPAGREERNRGGREKGRGGSCEGGGDGWRKRKGRGNGSRGKVRRGRGREEGEVKEGGRRK